MTGEEEENAGKMPYVDHGPLNKGGRDKNTSDQTESCREFWWQHSLTSRSLYINTKNSVIQRHETEEEKTVLQANTDFVCKRKFTSMRITSG